MRLFEIFELKHLKMGFVAKLVFSSSLRSRCQTMISQSCRSSSAFKSESFYLFQTQTNFSRPKIASIPTNISGIKYTSNSPSSETIKKKQRKKLTSKTKKTIFTKEDDDKILCKVKEMGCNNCETWKELAKDFDVECITQIKERWRLIMSHEINERKKFTEEEDRIILEYVKKNGESRESWHELAKILNYNVIHAPSYIRQRYLKLTKNCDRNSGRYSEEEDKLILKDVKKFGSSIDTCKKLAFKLNRPNLQNIKHRIDILEGKSIKSTKDWTLAEDKLLLTSLFKVYLVNIKNYLKLEKINIHLLIEPHHN